MTLNKAMSLGKRWQKNGMDRVYINLTEDIMRSEIAKAALATAIEKL